MSVLVESSSASLDDLISESRATRRAAARSVERSEHLVLTSALLVAEACAARLASRQNAVYAGLAGATLDQTDVHATVWRDGTVTSDERLLASLGGGPGCDPLVTTLAVADGFHRLTAVELHDAGRRGGGPRRRSTGIECRLREDDPPEPFGIDVETVGDTHVARLTGELDVAYAPTVEATLTRVAGSTVVVDLSDLRFIDAGGISALVSARKQISKDGHGFRVRGARGIVRRVFEIVDLGHLLED